MRRRMRLAVLIALFTLGVFPHTSAPASASPRGSGHIVAREVTLPQPAVGASTLSLDAGIPAGLASSLSVGSTGGGTLLYTSPAIAAGQLFDRLGVHWTEPPGVGDAISIEVRTSADALTWSDWSGTTDDDDMFDADRNEHYAAPLPASDGARFVQYRAWLLGGDASALARVGVTFMDVSDLNEGPLVTLLNDVRGAIGDLGQSYATAAPVGASKILTRQDWGADESLMKWTPEYKRVQKAIVHHTAGDDGGTNVAATIRAIYYFHAVTRGWGDIGYNFLVDKYGNIWTGRAGGDHVIGGHAYGWNNGSIGVAAIGTFSSTTPTPAMVGAIANIIAMKFAQFGIAPYGADPYTHQEQRSDGTWVPVTSSPPNIQGHRDSNYIVGQNGGQTECPGQALWNQLGTIRSLAQSAVQNGYTNLVALEPNLPKAGLGGSVVQVQTTVLNRGTTTIPGGTAVSYKILLKGAPYVNQGGQGAINAAIPPGAIGSATVPFTVPVIGNYMVRWDLESGGSWWNTLYNNPFRDMSFRSADWSADWISDTVPRTWFSGQTTRVSVTLTNDGGRVWPAAGVNPVVLGYRWIDDATGRVTVGANFANLPSDIQAGQTVTLGIDVTAPMTASASYTMELDLYKQNEFWFKDKGIPPDPTPTGVGPDYRATYQVGGSPQLQIGQTITVPVTVTNTGLGVFPAAGATPVDLSYHWYDQTGKLVVWEGLRTRLAADLRPGQAVLLQAQVQSPPDGGTYQLRFDLVLEGVSWFSVRGTATGNVTAAVCCGKTFGAQYQPQVTTFAVSGAGTTVPIALTNTGNFTWSAVGATPVHLGYHWTDTAGRVIVWDGTRSNLAADVAPGATQTVQAQIAFPAAPGTYVLKWDLVQEGVAWFSSKNVPTFDQPVSVTPSTTQSYAAAVDASGIPTAMATRMTTTVAVRVTNASAVAWGPNVNLSYHWLDGAGNVVTFDGLRTSVAGLGAGQTTTAFARIQGPLAAGLYTLRFDVVQEGVAWFSSNGATFPSVAERVVVPAFGAVYTVPVSALGPRGAAITVPVTLTNAGSLTWDPAQKFDLAYHIFTPSGAVFVWDGTRTLLSAPVAPGASVTVNATVTLPATPGSFALKFDLVQEGVSWFSGQGVPAESITLAIQ
ncbi:MAG: N-acetylmuramoyl-L-alanine amidase [Chloroflexota bacterium]|nr:N-acetylmuramoyl-L-alanine amidase [Chloroflexota bacterium]